MESGAPQHSLLTGRRLRLLALGISFCVAPLLFLGGPDWASGPLHRSAWNLGHIGLFALLTFAFKPWQWFSGWQLWLTTTAIVLLLGIVIEFLQAGVDRQADWRDILRNLEGVWLILAWQPVLSPAARTGRRAWTIAAASGLVLLFELGSTGVVAARQFQVNHQLPMLYDFRHEDTAPFWRGNLSPSPLHARDHRYSLKINLDTDPFSGVWLTNLPADWRGYERLTISLFNPDDTPLPLTLRINDVAHDRGNNAYDDRYNTRFVLNPGFNTFTRILDDIENAPRNRIMDMTEIRRIGLFTVRLQEPRTVYLSDLRLD